MSTQDTYVQQLEDLQAYTESEHFDVIEYMMKLVQLYKNGNFLAINLIGHFSKTMAETLNDNSNYDLALSVYLAGPTNLLDLDFSDQMDFLLHKGEFLAEYARNIDPSYKEMAMETLNEYGNMSSDGRHMRAKAYLEKPEDENDTLNMEVFKARLLEYFSYGNELPEEEISLVGIPSPYLSMEKEQLVELLKQYKNNPEELKKIYYVLLYKGEISYAYSLTKIDNQFILDYYLKKRDPFYSDEKLMDLIDSLADAENTKPKQIHRGFFVVNLLLVIVDIFCRIYPNYSIPVLFGREGALDSIWAFLFIVGLFASLLVPVLSFLFAKKGKINLLFGILSLVLGIETAFCGVIQLENFSYRIVLLILTGILFLVSGILSIKNASRKKAE